MEPLFLILGVLALGYPEVALRIGVLYGALLLVRAWRRRSASSRRFRELARRARRNWDRIA